MTKILRIITSGVRHREDLLAEVEYIRCLHDNDSGVSDVICSLNGNLLEEIVCKGYIFFLCLFEKVKGKTLAENGYRYREGIPVVEYYYNCGKTLGKLRQPSKEYHPIHHHHDFFRQIYNKLCP